MHPAIHKQQQVYIFDMNPELRNNARLDQLLKIPADFQVSKNWAKAAKTRMFLVEDNPTIRENLIRTLEELTPVETVGSAETAEEGADWLADDSNQWDLAIVDLFLKSGTGLSVLKACQNREPSQKIVIFSNYATREMRLRCAELGANVVFDKSTEMDALLKFCQPHSSRLVSNRWVSHYKADFWRSYSAFFIDR